MMKEMWSAQTPVTGIIAPMNKMIAKSHLVNKPGRRQYSSIINNNYT